MKRVFSLLLILSIALSFTAFQCTSTELTSAKLYIQQKNMDKAIESLKSEVKKNPKSDEGFYLLGFVQGEQGDLKDMLDNYSKSLEISKKFEKTIEESKKYHWADGFNRGVQLFNKGAKAGGDTDTAKTIFKKAVEVFNGAILCQPDSIDTYKNLAFAYINLGDRDAAIAPYRKIISLSKEESAYEQLGELYLKKGLIAKESEDSVTSVKNFDLSIEVLEEGREVHPNNGNILLLLSNVYIAANKLEIAKKAFKAGVEQDSENKFYRYNYGSLLLNADEYVEAAVQLEKALEIDSEYENAIYNLAVTYVKWGAKLRADAEENEDNSDEYKTKFESALPLLEKYLSIKEDEGVVWDLLGKVYANLGMGDKSKEAFDKADLYK